MRAIGDPGAVPALIDGLERCGRCSDYGLGEPKTELDVFYRQCQMDPNSDHLGLGRPVREISIALERLAGHTEGQDHFDFYTADGERMGSGTVTPETIDRHRQRLRAVARLWRQWWQGHQGTAQPAKGADAQTPAMPVGPLPQKRDRGVLAGPTAEGARVTLAIVPNVGDQGPMPRLTSGEYQRYVDNLTREAPWAGDMRGDSFQWSPVQGDANRFRDLPLATYQDRTYLLLCARSDYVMMPEVEGRWIWGLKKVLATQDTQGHWAIRVQFDSSGADLLTRLSQANVGNHVAICIDGHVQCASTLAAPLAREVVIRGDYTERQANALAEDLRKGGR